jgi:hypothetical protein
MSEITIPYDELPEDAYIISPDDETQIKEIGAYLIEGVAYAPLTIHFLCNYDDETPVTCQTCSWETTVGDLPSDSGAVQPPLCPACLKRDDTISGVRSTPLGAKPVAVEVSD